MPRLLLLRHAKSSWGDPGLPDMERPLSPRGRRNAAAMAKELDAEGLMPDKVLCSPARRTRETLAALLPYLDGEGHVAIEPKLYDSMPGDYISAIGRSGGEARTLMVIGHNPTIQATARWLSGDGEPGLLAELTAKYPTGALAVIVEANALVAAFVEDLEADAPTEGDDGTSMAGWIGDWRTYVADREDYVVRLREDPEARFLVDETDFGDSVDKTIEIFADVNGIPDCATPGDVG